MGKSNAVRTQEVVETKVESTEQPNEAVESTTEQTTNEVVETKVEPTIEPEVKAILEQSGSKSSKIRALLAMGKKRGEVAKLLGIRYQHVRNVELTPVKRVG